MRFYFIIIHDSLFNTDLYFIMFLEMCNFYET
jgi:hypothetical protein